MWMVKKIGDKYVGISQTGKGWNVSTWSVKGNRSRTFKSEDTSTLAAAQKKFTAQKRALAPMKKRSRRSSSELEFDAFIGRWW